MAAEAGIATDHGRRTPDKLIEKFPLHFSVVTY